ncbi:hypothetical protein CLV94_2889 [Flavobacterium endophyticum]|uniref:Uncharacterized protein n=1 Tax=Flavobacterium endophyticum TaxID=1540163 RepID=A0A495M5P2_9FLAO|nr:hypothetical protein [Flavobacterium endophyticum]RKS20510.1 hypothetical protein CLV94_2889 [Flavobacterium endophyticum]
METKDVIGILLFCIICSVVLIWGVTDYRDYKKEMASEKFNELPVYDKAHIKKYKARSLMTIFISVAGLLGMIIKLISLL